MNNATTIAMLPKTPIWQLAQRNQRLFVGALYTPEEVRTVVRCRGRRVPEKQQGWWLRCYWPWGMFAKAMAIRRAPRLQHTAMKIVGQNLDFLLIVQSLSGWQQRMLIPLLGPDVRDFVTALQTQPVHVCYSNADAQVMFVEPMVCEMGSVVTEQDVKDIPAANLQTVVDECYEAMLDALLPDYLDGSLAHLGENFSASWVLPTALAQEVMMH